MLPEAAASGKGREAMSFHLRKKRTRFFKLLMYLAAYR
jgi:hypothetical protein